MAEQFSWDRETPGFEEDTGVSSSSPAPCGRRAQGYGDSGPGGGAHYVDQDAFSADFAWCPWESWDNREVWVRQGVGTVAYLNERRIHELAKAWNGLPASEQVALAGSGRAAVTKAFARWTKLYPLSRWDTEPSGNHALYADWRAVTTKPISSAKDGELVTTFPWGTLGLDDRVNVYAVPAIQAFFAQGPAFARFRAWMAKLKTTGGSSGPTGSATMAHMGKSLASSYVAHEGFPASNVAASPLASASRGSAMVTNLSAQPLRVIGAPSYGAAIPTQPFYPDASVMIETEKKSEGIPMAYLVGGGLIAAAAAWYLLR